MAHSYTETVCFIREKKTKKMIKFGAKAGWATKGAAKNAFNLHMRGYFNKTWGEGAGLYDSQDEFEIVEIW